MEERNSKIENAIQEIKKELKNRDDIASSIGMQWPIDDVLYRPLEKKGLEHSIVTSAVRFLLNEGKYLVNGQSGGGYGTLTPEGWQWIFGKINVDTDSDEIRNNINSFQLNDQEIKNDESRKQSLKILRDYVKNIVSKLSPREQKILEMRFGLIDGIAHTLEEVGQEFEVTRESIRRIESKALEKIRQFEGLEKLREISDRNDDIKNDGYPEEFLKKIFNIQNDVNKKNKNTKFNYKLLNEGSLRMNTDSSKPSIGVEDISEEVSSILVNMRGQDGAMFGVFGRWGRGKTYLMSEIKKRKAIKDNFHFVDFNAWKYQDVPALWAYLYGEVLNSYLDCFWIKKFVRKFCLRIFRVGVFNFATTIIFSVLVTAITFVYGQDFIGSLVKNNKAYTFLVSIIPTIIFLFPLLEKFNFQETFNGVIKKITKNPGFFDVLGLQHEIQKELKTLLKAWGFCDKKSLLLIVDDIDRCSEDKIIKIVDCLKVILDDQSIKKEIVVVTAIDERILKRAIEYKYRNLIKKGDDKASSDELYPAILMREYMDKLFLCGLRLGKLTTNEIITIADNFCELNIDEDAGNKDDNSKKQDAIFKDVYKQHIDKLSDVGDKERGALLKHQMSKEERASVYVYAQEIENVTPRQIGIFVFRYLLARNILRIKGIDYDYEKLCGFIIDYMKNGYIELEDEIISGVIEMVVPY